ncbi:TonB-dependent receptor [Edaphobacter bradus]|uniref:TonB-dependent receptor n=1 Tax=Edaphobacter bradus TaxID=2259016 RepID=UPI0021DF5056|nr:TonB-dependent receptor [Edaphobacter bradus]
MTRPTWKRLSLSLAVLLTLAVAPPARPQTAGTGTISGTVTDTSGAAVPNATVQIVNTDNGAARNLTTNSDGYYSATFLQSGHYEVVLGGGPFGKVDRKNLQLTVGQTLSVDASLAAASVATEVQVTTEEPPIDTQRTEQSQTISQTYIGNLPVNGRRWDNFVLLTPNVAPDGSTGLVSYRGISGLYNTNLVDGVSNQQALFNEARGRSLGAPYVFSADSIKEFESAVSGYSAQFGGAAGGQVNAITKSGTNQLHGDLFYLLRYPTLNALDPYSKWSALHNGASPVLLTQTVHQQHQFGGSVGGPIIKDKLFGFFTYDGFRKVNPILYTSSTPAATLLGYANSTTTCPAPLTASQCTAAANFLISETTGTFPRNIKQDVFFPKLDYQLNGKNHLSASFLWQNFHQPNGYNTSPSQSNGGIQNNGTAAFHERFFVAGWDSVLGSSTANELRFQWSRDLETNTANGPGPGVTIGSGVIGNYGETAALPRIAEPDEHRIQFFDVISQTRGRHNFKAGVDLNFIHEIMINLFQGNGGYTYSGPAATSFANWVQDAYGVNGGQHYSTFTQVVDPITKSGKDDFWSKNLAGFFEDNWKVTSSLVLNLGIRYDTQLVPQPPRPFLTSANGQPSAIGIATTQIINTNYKMIQPRVGFAWSPYTGTVLRGGYGMFYGLIPLSAYYNVRVENGVFQQQYNLLPGQAGAPTNLNVLFTPPGPPLAAPFAGALTPQPIGVPAGQPLSPHGVDPHYTQPYTHSADLAIEQALPFQTTLSIGWVGTRGMRLPYSIDLNQPAYTGATRTYDVVDKTGKTLSTVTVPFYPAGLPKPDPGDGNFQVSFSGLNTWYNSLAVSLKKQMSYGFSALFNYTWAHTEDAGQSAGGASGANSSGGAFFGTDVLLDPFNRKGIYNNPAINMTREQARSDLDMRSRFVASLVWQPTLKTDNALARHAANGWTLAGTATEQTGFPVTAFLTNNPGKGVYTTNAGNTATAAGFDGSATGAANNTFNSPGSAFGRAPQVARNGFHGPGVHNIDLRVSRDFPIHENVRFQIVGEAFNLVNHRNGLGVATSAFSFVAPTATSVTCPVSGHSNTCIAPFVSSTPFGTINNTSGTLYGPRQLQVAAKLFF